jgi:hypothetical protein
MSSSLKYIIPALAKAGERKRRKDRWKYRWKEKK